MLPTPELTQDLLEEDEHAPADLATNAAAVANWILQTCLQTTFFVEMQQRAGSDVDSPSTWGYAAVAAATMGLFVAYVHRMHHQANQTIRRPKITKEEEQRIKLSCTSKIGLALHAAGDIISASGAGAAVMMAAKASSTAIAAAEAGGAVLGAIITIPETRSFANTARLFSWLDAKKNLPAPSLSRRILNWMKPDSKRQAVLELTAVPESNDLETGFGLVLK